MREIKLRDSNNRNKKTIVLIIVALLLVLSLIFIPNKISNFFYGKSSLHTKSLSSIGNRTSFILDYIFNADKLRKEKQGLEQERNQLIEKIISLKELEKENETLRQALNLDIDKDFNVVFAEVSGFDFPGDSFLINKGEKDGLSKNLTVITSRKVIVGKIVEVYDNFSKVMLITHKDSPVFDARIQGQDTIGVIRGQGRFSLILDLIDKQDSIQEEKGVITMGQVYPRGLFIGVVSEVINLDTEPFQQAVIKPLFNPKTISNVFIIKDEKLN